MAVYMNDAAFLKKGFMISTDKDLLDISIIYHYLDKESYWANGILPATLRKAIEHSMCFGIYHEGRQLGLARVITDKATFAYLCDVFILPPYRGIGLSKWLLQTIMNHPDLQGMRRWSLATLDAHEVYKQFGFEEITHPERWLQIFTPYIID